MPSSSQPQPDLHPPRNGARQTSSPSVATGSRASARTGLSTGSATQTITSTPSNEAEIPVRLHLRAGAEAEDEEVDGANDSIPRGRGERGHIRWAEGTVDNEGMGKKSSKVCCIYHPPTAPGESSDDSSSDSSSDSDSNASDIDDGAARPVGGGKRSRRHKHHTHNHNHDQHHEDKGKGVRKQSPNAYERQPKPKEVKK